LHFYLFLKKITHVASMCAPRVRWLGQNWLGGQNCNRK